MWGPIFQRKVPSQGVVEEHRNIGNMGSHGSTQALGY